MLRVEPSSWRFTREDLPGLQQVPKEVHQVLLRQGQERPRRQRSSQNRRVQTPPRRFSRQQESQQLLDRPQQTLQTDRRAEDALGSVSREAPAVARERRPLDGDREELQAEARVETGHDGEEEQVAQRD